MEDQDKDMKVARISDIIEQIEDLNKMIEMHKSNQGDQSTVSQYEFMRKQFVDELNQLLKDFQLNVKLTKPVA